MYKESIILFDDTIIVGTAKNKEVAEEMMKQGLISNWCRVKHYDRVKPIEEKAIKRELLLEGLEALIGYNHGQRVALENFRDVKPGEKLIIKLPQKNIRITISFVQGFLENIKTEDIEFEGNDELANTIMRYSKY